MWQARVGGHHAGVGNVISNPIVTFRREASEFFGDVVIQNIIEPLFKASAFQLWNGRKVAPDLALSDILLPL